MWPASRHDLSLVLDSDVSVQSLRKSKHLSSSSSLKVGTVAGHHQRRRRRRPSVVRPSATSANGPLRNHRLPSLRVTLVSWPRTRPLTTLSLHLLKPPSTSRNSPSSCSTRLSTRRAGTAVVDMLSCSRTVSRLKERSSRIRHHGLSCSVLTLLVLVPRYVFANALRSHVEGRLNLCLFCG